MSSYKEKPEELKMANSLREIVALPQNLGSIPSTQMVVHSVHNSNPSDTMPSSGDFEHKYDSHTYKQAKYSNT